MASDSPPSYATMLSGLPKPVRVQLTEDYHLRIQIAWIDHINTRNVAGHAVGATPSDVTNTTVPDAAAATVATPSALTVIIPESASTTIVGESPINKRKGLEQTELFTDEMETEESPTGLGKTTEEAIDVDSLIVKSPTRPKKDHGITIITGHEEINYHFTKASRSLNAVIKVVVYKDEAETAPTKYLNGLQLLTTVLLMTNASQEVMKKIGVDRIDKEIPNIGSRKDMITHDVIGFLTKNGTQLTEFPETESYESILTMEHDSPIIIEYAVTKHEHDSAFLPVKGWLQFCLYFRNQQLIIPFNSSATGLVLGGHFMKKKWEPKFTFEHYCTNNLHNKISPVYRSDGNNGKLIRKLLFSSAWSITMPAKQK